MTSTPRSDMRLASSWMVIVSGRTTSRDKRSFCSITPFMRWVRRRNAATERVRSSPSLWSALVTVRRPRCFTSLPRAGLTEGTTSLGAVSCGRRGAPALAGERGSAATDAGASVGPAPRRDAAC